MGDLLRPVGPALHLRNIAERPVQVLRGQQYGPVLRAQVRAAGHDEDDAEGELCECCAERDGVW
jgi:hypothetical protein